MLRVWPAWLLAALSASACANGTSSATPPSHLGAGANAENAWGRESWEQRHDDMTFVVLPNMARLFQRFRHTEAPLLTCRSCHGADAEEVGYRMPHGLSPLDPRRLPSEHDPDPKRAAVARFMREEVSPEMARLIGVPRISCFDCHPRQR